VAVVAAGALHVVSELVLSWVVAASFNAVVSIAFLAYVVWRARRSPGALRAWGMRRDNLGPAFAAQLAFAAAALFAASHWPEVELVALTFAAGTFLTLIYRRVPNLWAVGIAHAILGSLAVHLVLDVHPGAVILERLAGTP
jgi:hypothetical protein